MGSFKRLKVNINKRFSKSLTNKKPHSKEWGFLLLKEITTLQLPYALQSYDVLASSLLLLFSQLACASLQSS
jgi:hypothetical protein